MDAKDGSSSAVNQPLEILMLFTNGQDIHILYTTLVLHGRGSYVDEFAQEFLHLRLSDGQTLAAKLPEWRSVFPSSRETYSHVFEEDMPLWFDSHSLAGSDQRQGLLPTGLRESIAYVSGVIQEEAKKITATASKFLVAGISQGDTVTLWTQLHHTASENRVEGVFTAGTWLPLATGVEESHKLQIFTDGGSSTGSAQTTNSGTTYCILPLHNLGRFRDSIFVFMGHGVDDTFVDVKLGKRARDILVKRG